MITSSLLESSSHNNNTHCPAYLRTDSKYSGGRIVNVFETIGSRTSYRGRYKDTPVPREDLIKIMKAGLAAPSGCNLQTTSLLAVDDTDLLSKLREVLKPLADKLAPAPAVICVLTQKIFPFENVCFNVQDYSAAIQNMLLAIAALGYESCWYEGDITGIDQTGQRDYVLAPVLAELLGVPKDYELVCVLPVGVADQPLTRREKKPFEERAWFNGFKKI